MFSTTLLLLIKFLLVGNPEMAYPKDYFTAPLDGVLLLSGNFGELRANHFHSGIDFKTHGQVGKKVYSAAEGEVARIKISIYGYGKCIYIKHPNGFTTVYAHIQKFNPKIEEIIRNEQLRIKNYEVDFNLPPEVLKLTKRQWIAYSGNTGGSGGPHLHFEIRNTATEEPLNPMLFGFDILDNIAPTISGLRIYPLSDSSYVDGYNLPKSYEILLPKGSKNNYLITKKDTITVTGKIGFAINSLDKINNATLRCGTSSHRLEVDNIIVYEDRIEKLSFDTWRYVNTYTDYELYNRKKMLFHKSFVVGNNKLDIYKTLVKNGVVEFNVEKNHILKYTVKDAFGNSSSLVFKIKGTSKIPAARQVMRTTADKYFYYYKESIFYNQNIRVKIPPLALYENLNFNCTEMEENPKSLSPVWAVQNEYVPLQNNIELAIKTDIQYKAKTTQLGIVQVIGKDKQKWVGGSFVNNEITALTKNFGTYCIMADTIAPSVSAVMDKKKNIVLGKTITFKVKDGLAGIKSYNVTIDGKWVVAEYEFKNNAIYCYLESLKLVKGSHKIEVVALDNVENTTNFSTDFTIN